MLRVSLVAASLLFLWGQSTPLGAAPTQEPSRLPVPAKAPAKPVAVESPAMPVPAKAPAKPVAVESPAKPTSKRVRLIETTADSHHAELVQIAKDDLKSSMAVLEQEIANLRAENADLKARLRQQNSDNFRTEEQPLARRAKAQASRKARDAKQQAEVAKRRAKRQPSGLGMDLPPAKSPNFVALQEQYKRQVERLEERAGVLEAEIARTVLDAQAAQDRAEANARSRERDTATSRARSQRDTATSRSRRQRDTATSRVRLRTTEREPVVARERLAPPVRTDVSRRAPKVSRTTTRTTTRTRSAPTRTTFGSKVETQGSGMTIYTEGGQVIIHQSAPCEQCNQNSQSNAGSFQFHSLPKGQYFLNRGIKTQAIDSLLDPVEAPESSPEDQDKVSSGFYFKSGGDTKGNRKSSFGFSSKNQGADILSSDANGTFGGDAAGEIQALLDQMKKDMAKLAQNLDAVQRAMDHAHKTGSHKTPPTGGVR